MGDLFSSGDQSVSGEREDCSSPLPPRLRIDPYVASSLLQKAIRRGDASLAERAALTLHRLRGQGIWRRFLVIAFEDVGIGYSMPSSKRRPLARTPMGAQSTAATSAPSAVSPVFSRKPRRIGRPTISSALPGAIRHSRRRDSGPTSGRWSNPYIS